MELVGRAAAGRLDAWSRSPAASRSTTRPAYAAAGVDLISVGALTHSAPVLDLGLDLGSSRRATS